LDWFALASGIGRSNSDFSGLFLYFSSFYPVNNASVGSCSPAESLNNPIMRCLRRLQRDGAALVLHRKAETYGEFIVAD
jgi:hypothetical protein